MALPNLPAQGQNPWYAPRTAWDTAVDAALAGLSNVNNTSDANKPISIATQAALNNKAALVHTHTSSAITDFSTATTTLLRNSTIVQTGRVWPTFYGSRIGFIGDSYSSGVGTTNPTTERWPKLLANMLGATENNVAVPSSGYSNTGAGGASKFSQQAALLATNCTHVFICGGINDAPLGLSTAALQAEVTATIAAVRARIPNVPITIISPMWMSSAPTDQLLLVESQIRGAVPADIPFIENGPWIRIDRAEWQIGDGHPNTAGAAAIAAWVRDQLGGTPPGAEAAQFVSPGTADVVINTTNFPAYAVASGTIRSAKSGWWEVEGQMPLYGATNGFIFVTEQARQVSLRSDVGGSPTVHRQKIKFYHPGGDLIVKTGYTPSSGTPSVITNNQAKVTARRLGIAP